MRVILVIDDILKVDTRLSVEIFKELLVEDKGHPGYLLYAGLSLGVMIDEVGSYGNRQFPSKLFPSECCE